MIAFIDDQREVYGVEPICGMLRIAPSTYRAHVVRRADPARASPRARQDLVLTEQIRRVHATKVSRKNRAGEIRSKQGLPEPADHLARSTKPAR